MRILRTSRDDLLESQYSESLVGHVRRDHDGKSSRFWIDEYLGVGTERNLPHDLHGLATRHFDSIEIAYALGPRIYIESIAAQKAYEGNAKFLSHAYGETYKDVCPRGCAAIFDGPFLINLENIENEDIRKALFRFSCCEIQDGFIQRLRKFPGCSQIDLGAAYGCASPAWVSFRLHGNARPMQDARFDPPVPQSRGIERGLPICESM